MTKFYIILDCIKRSNDIIALYRVLFLSYLLMDGENQTTIQSILLLGFQMPSPFKIPIFILILLLYSLTITGNLLIISLVYGSPTLQHPMFFFLTHLSLSDICLTTDIVPNMLYVIKSGPISITMAACMTQFQFFGTVVTFECLLLAVMSYDRQLAICNPLRYASIMGNQLPLWLVIVCWSVSFTVTLGTVVMLTRLDFCNLSAIDHFFCDFDPILQLSCSDTAAVELEQMIIGSSVAVFPLGYITVTYIHIFICIFRISSKSGREKTFSTCSSHLAIVSTFFSTLIAIYVVPSRGTSLNVVSVLYTVVTPLSNSIIYSLRNSELRSAFKKHVNIYNICKMSKLSGL
uniref:G-protein coupled receptors family 1 profile domain-containing protein n=1 Tax=Xenopus tropicalis TaxID=8364 RepID=A0A803JLQ3_XENTR